MSEPIQDKPSRIDSLTGLTNGYYLREDPDRIFPRHNRIDFVYTDFDGLIYFNAWLGRTLCDRFIAEAASLMKDLCNPCLGAYRIHGDEFAFLLAEMKTADVLSRAIRLRDAVKEHFASAEPMGRSI